MDDTPTPPPAQTRRRFIAQAAGGTALFAAGVGLANAASGQEAEDGAEVDVNKDTAVFAETFELAAVEIYNRITATGRVLSPLAVGVLADFSRHHAEHAQAFAQIAGRDATGRANQRLVQVFADQLEQATSEQQVLRTAFDLETAITSTYVASGAAIDGDDLVTLTAAVVPVEAQHAAVAARLAGVEAGDATPAFEDLDHALDITQYPATTTTSTVPTETSA